MQAGTGMKGSHLLIERAQAHLPAPCCISISAHHCALRILQPCQPSCCQPCQPHNPPAPSARLTTSLHHSPCRRTPQCLSATHPCSPRITTPTNSPPHLHTLTHSHAHADPHTTTLTHPHTVSVLRQHAPDGGQALVLSRELFAFLRAGGVLCHKAQHCLG